MKLCTAVQEGCGYKDTLHAHRYYVPLAKYFAVCITYQLTYVHIKLQSVTDSTLSPKMINQLMLKETTGIYSENHMEHLNTL